MFSMTENYGMMIRMDQYVNKKKLSQADAAAAAQRLAAFRSISAVEGLVADAEMIELFERFEREQWSHERRRAFIQNKFAKRSA